LPAEPQAAFFSYSRDDSEFALRLAADLKAAGANVWLDQLDIAPGQRWARAVQDALNNCRRLLVILSPSSVSSTNVEDEVVFALEEHKTVIPIFCRDCKVPFQLRPFQYVDFRTNYDHGLRTLLKTLGVEQPAAAGGGAAVSAVPKDTATDVPDTDERERAAEQQRLEQEEKHAAAQARLEDQKHERKAAEDMARPFLSKKKKMMIGLGGGAIVLLLLWILRPRGFNNQALQPQTSVQETKPQAAAQRPRVQTTAPQTQPHSTMQQPQGTGQQPQTTEPQQAAAGAKKPGAPKKCPGGVYCDPGTNLMWTMEDNGKDTDWQGADQYCRSLTLAGLSDWDLPDILDLDKLYDPQSSSGYKIRNPLRLTSNWVWSSTKAGSGTAWGFFFTGGLRSASPMDHSNSHRALCVRLSGE
jgi:hypothetical protein